MEKLHCHLETEDAVVKTLNCNPTETSPNLRCVSHLVHPRGSEEDPHLLCVFLQFPVLLVAEFQMALVLPVRFPPGVFGGVGALQGPLVKLVL